MLDEHLPITLDGGGGRNRTDDLLLAKQVLSHLSYAPGLGRQRSEIRLSFSFCPLILVGLGRFELPTSRLSGVRSNQLSYRPVTKKPWAQAPRLERPNTGAVLQGRDAKAAACRLGFFDGSQIAPGAILRKEVIQPQVPLRLPCYDFTPVADLTVAGCLLTVSTPSSGKTNSHGVTGGVYKARERIHRGMLIRDY